MSDIDKFIAMEEHQIEVEKLRLKYIEELSEIVNYGGNDRPRVRHPGNWARLPSQIYLNEKHEHYVDPITLYEEQNVWIWSDLHFFHKNIIKFSERPFMDVDEMNEHLIANHNEYVHPNDISIWVGDVGFSNDTKINALLDRCYGYKILIIGNHDFNKRNVRNLNFDEIHLIYSLPTPEGDLVLTHYPMHKIEDPWFNLHGHLHVFPNHDTGHPLHLNVNCELYEYRPMLMEDICKMVRMRKIAAEM